MRTFTLTNGAGDRATITGDSITLSVDDDENVTAAPTTEAEAPPLAPVEGSATFEGAPPQEGPQEAASGPETAAEAPEGPTTAPDGSDEAEGTVEAPGVDVTVEPDTSEPEVAAVVNEGGPRGRFTLAITQADGTTDTRTVEADSLAAALADELGDGAQSVTVRRVEAVA